MFRFVARIAALATLVIVSSSSAAAGAPTDTAIAATAPTLVDRPRRAAEVPISVTSIYGDSAELEATGRNALKRFSDEGLDLPAIDLRIYASEEPCRAPDGTGRAGVTTIYADRYEVRSCGTEATLFHELAHVWDHHVLDDSARRALLKLRGLDSWAHETWSSAGGEHLASIVAWALTGDRPPMISPADDASLATAYQLVTGTPAPTLAERGLALVDGRLRRISALRSP